MKSVLLNNTLQEDWQVAMDTEDEWSHCCVSPVFVLFSDIAGIRPTAPGFARCQIRPQLADLGDLDLTYYTVLGPLRFSARRRTEGHRVEVSVPAGCQAELLLPDGEAEKPPEPRAGHPLRLKRFRLEPGKPSVFDLLASPRPPR